MFKLKNHDEVYEALVNQIKEFQCKLNGYQTDVYLYIEEGRGTIDTFLNVGGNGWVADEHYTIYTDIGDRRGYSKMDDLSDGGNSFSWLIGELEKKFNLSGIEEKAFEELTSTMDSDTLDEEGISCFDDLDYYDVQRWLESNYSDEIDQYYEEDYVPNYCMNFVTETAYNALDDFENDHSFVVEVDGKFISEHSDYDEALCAAKQIDDAEVDIWSTEQIQDAKYRQYED